MMKMKKYILMLLLALLAIPAGMASGTGDDDDKDPSVRPGIRRLHPERERAKAMKKLQEQMSRKAEPKEDPWDMTDEVWGTVDLPPVALKDSAAVEGHRVGPRPDSHYSSTGQDGIGSDSEYGSTLDDYGYYRMTWQDLPVTSTIDQLMPSFVVSEAGDYLSKYVSGDGTGDEVYFTFNMSDSLPGPLRLCMRCRADDEMDLDQVIFSIDGYNYMFYPREHRQGRLGDGALWMMVDDELDVRYKDLIFALAHGHVVAIKLMSTRGAQRVKLLNDGQRADFAATLDLYRLLGGQFR